jgi:selenocysteine-specific elongation factor
LYVIGTAGHVDHGKSTLVTALTGIDPDRLKEEQEREMTIDLGFAWLELPSGEIAGIVDVPGHKDFIKNMLAGVGGIDAALFVVAADEGIMPQTREHLSILDLLEIDAGVVAITKKDLAEDEEWLELVMAEVETELEGTCLENAPLIPISARTGEGLPDLLAALEQVLSGTKPRRDIGYPRLPIDRIFTIAGFGTVLTGTLLDGQLRTGQEVEILPTDLKARIRGLQTHKEKIETAEPGSRVAVNLTGVAVTDLLRGDVLTVPGWLSPTKLVDVRLTYLKSAPNVLKHSMELDFFCGSTQTPAFVRLLDRETLQPGQMGWAQLRLKKPVVVRKGDHFIVRLPSPSLTVGGGTIVDVHPKRRHRRFRDEVIQHLETQAHGSPDQILLQSLESQQPCEARELVKRCGLGESAALESLNSLLQQGQVIVLRDHGNGSAELPNPQASNALIISVPGWRRFAEQLTTFINSYHEQYPLRKGIAKEELKSRLRLATRVFNEVIPRAVWEGHIKEQGPWVSLADYEVAFDAETQGRIDTLLNMMREQPYATPSSAESEKVVGTEALNALIEQGTLVRVHNDVLFLRETYDEMVTRITATIQEEGSITVAQVRDMFRASRKYALGLMEYLDEKKITRRQGDVRILR